MLASVTAYLRNVLFPGRHGMMAKLDATSQVGLFGRTRFVVVCFCLSSILTAFFIKPYQGYVSKDIMLLSGAIAGGKWAVQLVLGWFLLGEKRWPYLEQLAVTCLIGSLVLQPFALFPRGSAFFFGSLIACILIMGSSIVVRLRAIGLSWRWIALWFALLAIAVTLQLTVVFHVI